MDFTDKKVIVTGANKSIGKQMAESFAKQGADVAISYHSDAEGANQTCQAIKSIGRSAQSFHADFSDIEQSRVIC